MRLILASASPRRAELLSAAGIAFDVRPADIDESVRAGEPAGTYVRRLAEEKARAAAADAPPAPVLAADTIVLVGGAILGKPSDTGDAKRMLRLLSGAPHQVITGVCLLTPPGLPGPAATDTAVGLERDNTGAPAAEVRAAVTIVEFAHLTDEEIDWYVATGEPMDKAGAYAIQGFASRFVTRLEGSYSNVVGLPVALVYEMCREAGLLLS